MATKSFDTGKKRKAVTSAAQEKKKPRLEAGKKTFKKPSKQPSSDEEDENMDDFEAFSDSDDGGVELGADEAKTHPSREKNVKQANGGAPTETSREAHAKQKQLVKERKAAKPLADEVQRTKKIWEKLRRKSHVPREERQKLVDELFEIISGRIKDLVLKHDAVRAVQTAIKYASAERRKQIAQELKGTYAQLAESRYAKFLIGKLLTQQDDEIRDLIIPEFYGKIKKLINHPEASWILDDIYRGVATKEQKAIILREWYGPEFALMSRTSGSAQAAATAELAQILEAEPSKRGPIMKNLFGMINLLVQKNMTGFTTLHDAMLQYFLNLKPESEERTEFVETIKGDETGDLLKNMAFTQSGARLSCLLLAQGNAKDRKQLLKAYKDTFNLMAGDQYAHAIVLTAFDVIDDTKLSSKAIYPELIGSDDDPQLAHNIVAAANNPNARIVLLYPIEGTSKSLFPARRCTTLQILEEVHEIRKTTSKKDPELRLKELTAAMSSQVLKAIASNAQELSASPFGCHFLTEALLGVSGDKQEALEAVAAVAGGDPTVKSDDVAGATPHVSQTSHGGRMLKSLVAGGKYDRATGQITPIDPPLNFANVLYPAIKEHIVAWATGSSSFVVVNILAAKSFKHGAQLKKTLAASRAALEKAASEEMEEQKAARLAREAKADAATAAEGAAGAAKGKKGKKAAPAKKEDAARLVGNPGTKLLLESI